MLLQAEVPGLNVAPDKILVRSRDVRPKRHLDSLLDRHRRNVGESVVERRGERVRIRRGQRLRELGGQVAAQVAPEVERVVRQAVAHADDERVAGAPGDPHARRELRLALRQPAIAGNRTDAADIHHVLVDVETLDSAVGPDGEREILPADAVAEGQVGTDVPAVPDVERRLTGAGLQVLSRQEVARRFPGKAEHERRDGVVIVRPGAGTPGRVVPEPETSGRGIATWEVGHLLVDVCEEDIRSEADFVVALRPVAICHPLVEVVVADERRGGLIPQISEPRIEPHAGHSAVECAGLAGNAVPVRARYAEDVQADSLIEIAGERVAVHQR